MAIFEDHQYTSLPSMVTTADLNPLLLHTTSLNASDVFIRSGKYIMANVFGNISQISKRKLAHKEIETWVEKIYEDQSGILKLNSREAINKMYIINDGNNYLRYRANIIQTDGGMGTRGYEITLRTIPLIPPDLDLTEIPMEIVNQWFQPTGMCLVVGATGSGKSTLIASLVKYVMQNPNVTKRIVTYEAPIEFTFERVPELYSMITQTEVPTMIPTFKLAIEEALRRAPHDIYIGEMRDTQTIDNALLAAKSGHLLYSTLHVSNVAETLKRVSDMYPGDMRKSVLGDMVTNMRVIVSQRLLKTLDGKRTPIREYLVFNDKIRRELLSGDMDTISMRLQDFVNQKGVPFIVHCRQRVLEGKISNEYLNQFMAESEMNLADIDKRIKELKEDGNVMFQNNDL